MIEIIVKKKFSVSDIKDARLKAAAERRNRATSNASNVLNLADLKMAIGLCQDGCTKRFNWRRHGYYRQREYPYVNGDCDACRAEGRLDLFIHESVLKQVWVTKEEGRASREYAKLTAT